MPAHSYDVQEAVDYGLEEAIIIWNLRFWIIKNKANKKHEHLGEDGIVRTWTYNTNEAFQRIFPYWKKGAIERTLGRMIEKKIIIKDNFNPTKYDRTAWYAFFDEDKFLAPHLIIGHFSDSGNANPENEDSNSRKQKIENSETENRSSENGKYNTDTLPDKNPNKKPDTKEGSGSFSNENGWTVEDVALHLTSETKNRIKAANLDLTQLLKKYVPWINSKGAPKDIDAAFPAWVEKFKKIKLPNPEDVGEESSFHARRFDFKEEEHTVRKKIRGLLTYFPAEIANIFMAAPLEKALDHWKILVLEKYFERVVEHQELLAQINVKIEISTI